MQKGFTPILILVGILIIIGIVGGAYLLGTKNKTLSETVSEQNPVIWPVNSPEPDNKPSPDTNTLNATDKTANPDPIGANWKTFTKLGYEIKYPPSSVITEYDLDSSMPDLLASTSTEVKIEGRQSPALFLVYVWKNMGVNITNSASREKWCSMLEKELTGQLQCRYQNSLPVVKVNGYTAYQATGGRDSTYVKTIYIPHNNYVYELTVPIGDDTENKFPISDQILSTFKFTQ